MGGYQNPFWSNYDQAAGAQQAIQNAQIQREANARLNAKQAHDFAVDDLEQRMKILSMGGQAVGPNGAVDGGTLSVPGSTQGRMAVPQSPGDPNSPSSASVPPPPAAVPMQSTPPSAPTTDRIANDGSYVPTGSPGWGVLAPTTSPSAPAQPTAPQPSASPTSDRMAQFNALPLNAPQNMNLPTGPVGPLPADPSRTVTLPSGAQFQIPSLDALDAQADARVRGQARAEGLGKNDAEQDDYERNKVQLGPDTAKVLGMEPGTEVDRRKLPTYIQDATRARQAQASADNARALQEMQMQRENEIERHNRETEATSQQNADTMAKRADAQDARLAKIGAGDGQKPATKAQFAQVEARKAQSIVQANRAYEKALSAARVNGQIDPQASAAAADQYHTDLQNGQDAYENEITALGGTPTHYEYPLTRGKVQAQAAAAPAAPAPRAAPAPARPAAAPPAGTPQTAPAVTPSPAAGTPPPATQPAQPQKIISGASVLKFATANKISVEQARQILTRNGGLIGR